MSIIITFKPNFFDGEVKDNSHSFPAGLVYLAVQAEASDERYSGSISGWVRPEVRSLVKAAPELLEALVDLGDWLAYGLNKAERAEPTAEDHAACARVAAKARAAINKATGVE